MERGETSGLYLEVNDNIIFCSFLIISCIYYLYLFRFLRRCEALQATLPQTKSVCNQFLETQRFVFKASLFDTGHYWTESSRSLCWCFILVLSQHISGWWLCTVCSLNIYVYELYDPLVAGFVYKIFVLIVFQ